MKKGLIRLGRFWNILCLAIFLPLLAFIDWLFNMLAALFVGLGAGIFISLEVLLYAVSYPANVNTKTLKWGIMTWKQFRWYIDDTDFGTVGQWYKEEFKELFNNKCRDKERVEG